MTDNPYQTPQGELIPQTSPSETAGLYIISKKKLLILFTATLGFYLTYWFYRNWRLHKQATGENIWPVPRALFSVFFVHSLFRTANHKRDSGPTGLQKWKHGQHATITVLLLLSGNIADRLSSRSIGTPITSYLSLLLLIPIATCIAAAQDKINEACGDPRGESNSRFTGANYVWIFIGVLIWILVGIGIFMPAPSA